MLYLIVGFIDLWEFINRIALHSALDFLDFWTGVGSLLDSTTEADSLRAGHAMLPVARTSSCSWSTNPVLARPLCPQYLWLEIAVRLFALAITIFMLAAILWNILGSIKLIFHTLFIRPFYSFYDMGERLSRVIGRGAEAAVVYLRGMVRKQLQNRAPLRVQPIPPQGNAGQDSVRLEVVPVVIPRRRNLRRG